MNQLRRYLAAAVPAAALSSITGLRPAKAEAGAAEQVREVEIVVDGGYKPNRVAVQAGERLRLKFIRREHTPCTREVVIEAAGIRRQLPPEQAVVIELPALRPGEYEFKCGMNMVRGTIAVSARA
jgi:plastocyanin domain-containing protein